MWFEQTRKSQRRTRKRSSKKSTYIPLVEALEERRVLAGNVNAVVAGGILTLTETTANLANQIQIEPGVAPFTLKITGLTDTTINGQESIVVTGVNRDIVINLKGGDDEILISGITLGRDVKVNDTAGDTVFDLTNSLIGRDVVITNKTGSDDNFINNSTIGRNLTINNGLGGSTNRLKNSEIGGSVAVTAPANDDSGDDVGINDTEIGKDLTLNLANGENDLTITGTAVIAGKITMKTGIDEDEVLIDGDGDPLDIVLGAIQLDLGTNDDGNNVRIRNATVTGDLKVTTGTGEDDVTIATSILSKNTTLALGAGDNSVDISATVFGPLSVTGGADDDDVTIHAESVGTALVTLNLGAGDSRVGVLGSILHSLKVTTTTGFDTVTIGGVVIAQDVTLNLGAGGNRGILGEATIGGTYSYTGTGLDTINIGLVEIGGNLVLKTGNVGGGEISIGEALIAGNVDIKTGTSLDVVDLGLVQVLGSTSINTGNGNDTVTIYASVFFGDFKLLTGSGQDDVDIEGARALALDTNFLGKVNVNLGADNDILDIASQGTVTMRTKEANSLVFDGGPGTEDTLISISVNIIGVEQTPVFKNFEIFV